MILNRKPPPSRLGRERIGGVEGGKESVLHVRDNHYSLSLVLRPFLLVKSEAGSLTPSKNQLTLRASVAALVRAAIGGAWLEEQNPLKR